MVTGLSSVPTGKGVPERKGHRCSFRTFEMVQGAAEVIEAQETDANDDGELSTQDGVAEPADVVDKRDAVPQGRNRIAGERFDSLTIQIVNC